MSQEISEKKRLLLEYKEKLLNSIKSCEQEIFAVKACHSRKTTFVDSDDSDSDDDIHTKYKQRLCPDTSQLRSDYDQLRICLHATEELTELHVLESVVNILVDPPGFAKSLTDLEEGVWKEVCAECRIGLVGFSMTFFVHQPNRKFSAASYHNLQVNIPKPLHEKALSKSILEDAVRPSDAVQIINEYAKAAKSRKQTLSSIAEHYPEGEIYMKFLSDGGCLLKCHDVMELTWHLQNVRSPVAPFYHKMCFNLDYLGPEYMKDLNNAYKNIHDPNLSTERRTILLLKIINICLEAKTQDSEISDEIPQAVKNRRVTLEVEMNEHEILADRNKKRDEDTMAMAPPKSLPKKAKTPLKRPGGELNDVARKKVKHGYKERSEHYFKDKEFGKQNKINEESGSNDVTEHVEKTQDNVNKNKKKPRETIEKNNDYDKSSQTKKTINQDNKKTKSKNNVIDENKINTLGIIDKNNDISKPALNKETNSKNNVDVNKKKSQEIVDRINLNSKSSEVKTISNVNKKKTHEINKADKNIDKEKALQKKNTESEMEAESTVKKIIDKTKLSQNNKETNYENKQKKSKNKAQEIVKDKHLKNNVDKNKQKKTENPKPDTESEMEAGSIVKNITDKTKSLQNNKETNHENKQKDTKNKPQEIVKDKHLKINDEKNNQKKTENPKPVTDKVTKINSEIQKNKQKMLQSKDAAKGIYDNNLKNNNQKGNNKEKKPVSNNTASNKNKEAQKPSNIQKSKDLTKNDSVQKNKIESSDKNNVKQTNEIKLKEKNKLNDNTIVIRENMDKNVQKANNIKIIAPVLKEKNLDQNSNNKLKSNNLKNKINEKYDIPTKIVNNKINEAKTLSKIPLMKGVGNKKILGNIRTSPRISTSTPKKYLKTAIRNSIQITPLRHIQKTAITSKNSITNKLKNLFSLNKK